MFTGDLDAPVTSYPPFPGSEKNLLRAQISRISAATVIVPTGVYNPCEEDSIVDHDVVDDAEGDSDELTIDTLKELDGWQHYDLEINSWGRSLPLPEPENGEEEEQDPPYPDAKPVLQAIAEDDMAADEAAPIWWIRVVNKKMAVVKSLNWPGAYAVGDGKRFVNIYVGLGTKYSKTPYTPAAPQPLQQEFKNDEESGEEPWEGKEQADILDDPTAQEAEEEEED